MGFGLWYKDGKCERFRNGTTALEIVYADIFFAFGKWSFFFYGLSFFLILNWFNYCKLNLILLINQDSLNYEVL